MAATPTTLQWNELSFHVPNKVWPFIGRTFDTSDDVRKNILKCQTGSISAGSLTAVMGPSGSGKSTLLKCLTGHLTDGINGSIKIKCSDVSNMKIGLVPQQDYIFKKLTVEETFKFASKMKNTSFNVNHDHETENMINKLHLQDCQQLKVDQCSGGQIKRISIGVELISHPNILALDEPTSGLDSSSAVQCIKLLRSLMSGDDPPAIIMTIHQNIYFGCPSNVSEYLESFNLICPSSCNPADFAIEIAYGDHGEQVLIDMERETVATNHGNCHGHGDNNSHTLREVLDQRQESAVPRGRHVYMLMVRSWRNMFRDSSQFWLKNAQSVVVAMTLSYLWTQKIGQDDGCWSSSSSPDEMSNDQSSGTNITQAMDKYTNRISTMIDNSALLFAMAMHTMTTNLILCILSFPFEANIVLREVSNKWFTISSYFWAKVVSEIPSSILMNTILVAIVYPMTGQIPDLWRFIQLSTIICVVAEIGQSIGMIFGILFCDDVDSAMIITVSSSFPVLLLGGFVVRTSVMSWFLNIVSNISYLKFAFQASLITIYGFGRCSNSNGTTFVDEFVSAVNPMNTINNLIYKSNISTSDIYRYSNILDTDESCLTDVYNSSKTYFGQEQDMIDTSRNSDQPSYVLFYYDLNDVDIVTNITALICYLFIVKLIAFLSLKYKTK